jgi:ribA/ribD-fused uncharacterized protein
VNCPRSVAELCRLHDGGDRLTYLYFWGHTPSRDGSVGKECLSQWWVAPFTVDGVAYRSAEHWMMAQKARLFGDEDAFARIVAAGHPEEVKKLGRTIGGFDEAEWAAHRFEIVIEGNVAKFGQHPDLGAFLRSTGERVLVEASPVDRIWGIGLAAADERAADPHTWNGLNLLGFALMEARGRLFGS